MEDVLNIYERDYDPKEPVICLDEKPVQLLGSQRNRIPARCGRIAKQDHEYIRLGSVNVFCSIEPKAGRHFIRPTKQA
jgi:hypothetical protein